ncbi:MAG: hypothetical protein WBF67_04180 [Olleya sp.]
MLDQDINKEELVKIIRSLVSFIVLESKTYISEDLKETYIKHYIQTLTKSMNGIHDFVNANNIWKSVEQDASFIIENLDAIKTSEN